MWTTIGKVRRVVEGDDLDLILDRQGKWATIGRESLLSIRKTLGVRAKDVPAFDFKGTEEETERGVCLWLKRKGFRGRVEFNWWD